VLTVVGKARYGSVEICRTGMRQKVMGGGSSVRIGSGDHRGYIMRSVRDGNGLEEVFDPEQHALNATVHDGIIAGEVPDTSEEEVR